MYINICIVSIVSGYERDNWVIEVWFSAEVKNFCSSLYVQTGSGAHPASCTVGHQGSRRDADHSTPSSAEVENEWELYSSPPWGPSWHDNFSILVLFISNINKAVHVDKFSFFFFFRLYSPVWTLASFVILPQRFLSDKFSLQSDNEF
jgi:hypothetical protein